MSNNTTTVKTLHSTVVLLKAIPMDTLLFHSLVFTFYCSSIKGAFICPAVFALSNFTFYCSSIKGDFVWPFWTMFNSLHSTVVLLKVWSFFLFLCQITIFTFYCSSIKGVFCPSFPGAPNHFTFYCSSIKGKSLTTKLTLPIVFTFYCSSIKGSRPMPSSNSERGLYILL